MEQGHVRGDHGVGARIVDSKGCEAEWASYLFELQLGPSANVGIGVEGRYYATSNGGGIHLDVKMRACTYRGVWVVCLEAGERKGRECVLMRVCRPSALRTADCGLRCGAVRCLSRRHLTKIDLAGRKRSPRATAGQRNQLQQRSRGLL